MSGDHHDQSGFDEPVPETVEFEKLTAEADSTRASMMRHLGRVLGFTLLGFTISEIVREAFFHDAAPLARWALSGILLTFAAGVTVYWGWARPERQASLRRRAVRTERERALRQEHTRQQFDARLHRALEMADREHSAIHVIGKALGSVVPDRPTELLLADSSDSHLEQATASGPEVDGAHCPVENPWSCAAVRRGQSLAFPSSDDLDACPKLEGRSASACSAVCVPVTIMGRAIGVIHTIGPEGVAADMEQVRNLETVAMQAGARIGMLRAIEKSQQQAATDPLTGLLNRRSLEEAVRKLVKDGTSYAVGIADLDRFKRLNDTFGHDAGDRALCQFSDVARQAVRPEDIVARYGGEEFVFVFPNCTEDTGHAALDRIREELVLAQSDAGGPTFTSSFGVADTRSGAPFDALLTSADNALLIAKRTGRNQVVRASGAAERLAEAEATGILDAEHIDR